MPTAEHPRDADAHSVGSPWIATSVALMRRVIFLLTASSPSQFTDVRRRKPLGGVLVGVLRQQRRPLLRGAAVAL
jgi:hypothetical protein